MKRHRAPSSKLKQTTLGKFFGKRPCPNGAAKKELIDSAFTENTPPLTDAGLKLSPKTPSPTRSPFKLLQTDFFNFDDDDGFEEEWVVKEEEEDPLKFDRWLKCVVIACELNTRPYEKRVQVKYLKQMGHLRLRDMWAFNFDLSEGQVIGVQADLLDGEWIVDAQHGFVSLDPENLISSTSLIGAMFCRRKGVFSTVFKDLDSDSRVMTIGNLVHELFQKSLLLANCEKKTIEKIMYDLLALPNTIRMLFTCNMTMDDAKKELKIFVPQILKIIKTFITREIQPDGNNFRGIISKIVDIEESVTSLCIGIKGRIDVTAESIGNQRLPIEVKTGRASFSNEHRSQVILYTMMLKEIGHCTESGLLAYVREGIVQEIKATHSEMRDLILLRNEFVQYVKQFDPNFLPQPIRQIKCCEKCPYLGVCSAYLDKQHALQEIAPAIDEKHVTYFRHWSKLLLLDNDTANAKLSQNLIMNGVLSSVERNLSGNRFQYWLDRESDQLCGITCGSFIRMSAQTVNDSYVGYVAELTDTRVSVLIDREITQPAGCVFTIEGYRSTMLSRNMSNLAMLLEPRHESLRRRVIDCQPSNDLAEIPKSLLTDALLKILSDLNKQQQRAVLRTLTCHNHYLLVQGPPGTGKTQTIVAMVKALLANNQTVLLTGHSHSSVDNILLRLSEYPFLRLGNLTNIDVRLHEKSYGKLIGNVKSLDGLRDLLMNTPIVATTCLGFDTDLALQRKFSVCIVDESSQVLQPEILKPLFACDAFVLVGDSKQLQPVVRSVEARKMGMSESLFERLDKGNSEAIVTLTDQYRMNTVIMDMANQLMYDGILKTGSKHVGEAVLKISATDCGWLKQITSPALEDSLLFIDTSDYLNLNPDNNSSCSNVIEAKVVTFIVVEMMKCGLSADQIGIMAPYRDQVNILRKSVDAGVEVNTVDQYQGRDKDCVIMSCTRQNRTAGCDTSNELLDDERRLCVAVTRAKHKLLFVGDRTTLMTRYRPFQRFFDILSDTKVVRLENGVDQFLWNSL